MTDGICGYVKDDGEKCQRVAGWGTDSDLGHCRDHREEYRVPRKLTPEVRSTIIGAARRGAFDWIAAELAGITPNTLSNWKTWAQDALDQGIETELTEFYLEYRRAHAAGAVERLQEADDEFVLERKYGYNKTERHEFSGPGGGPIRTEEVTEEERELLDAAFDAEPET